MNNESRRLLTDSPDEPLDGEKRDLDPKADKRRAKSDATLEHKVRGANFSTGSQKHESQKKVHRSLKSVPTDSAAPLIVAVQKKVLPRQERCEQGSLPSSQRSSRQNLKYSRRTSPSAPEAGNCKRYSAASQESPRSSGVNHLKSVDSRKLVVMGKRYLNETFESKKWNRFTLGTLPRRSEKDGMSSSESLEDSLKSSAMGIDSLDPEGATPSSLCSITSRSIVDSNFSNSNIGKTSQACQTSSIGIDSVNSSIVRKKESSKTKPSKQDKKVGNSLPKISDNKMAVYKKSSSLADDVSDSKSDKLYENMDSLVPPVPPRTYKQFMKEEMKPPLPPRDPKGSTNSDLGSSVSVVGILKHSHSTLSTGSIKSEKVEDFDPFADILPKKASVETLTTNNRFSQVISSSNDEEYNSNSKTRTSNRVTFNTDLKSPCVCQNSSLGRNRDSKQSPRARQHQLPPPLTERASSFPDDTLRDYLNVSGFPRSSGEMSPGSNYRNPGVIPINMNVTPIAALMSETPSPLEMQMFSDLRFSNYQKPVLKQDKQHQPKLARLSRFFSRNRNNKVKKPQQNYINFCQGTFQANSQDSGFISQEILSAGEDAKQFALKRAAMQKHTSVGSNRTSFVETQGLNASNFSNENSLDLPEMKLSKTNPFYDQVLEEMKEKRNSSPIDGGDRPCLIVPSLAFSKMPTKRHYMRGNTEPIRNPNDPATQRSATLTFSSTPMQSPERSFFGRKLFNIFRYSFNRKSSPAKSDPGNPTSASESPNLRNFRSAHQISQSRPVSSHGSSVSFDCLNPNELAALNLTYSPLPVAKQTPCKSLMQTSPQPPVSSQPEIGAIKSSENIYKFSKHSYSKNQSCGPNCISNRQSSLDIIHNPEFKANSDVEAKTGSETAKGCGSTPFQHEYDSPPRDSSVWNTIESDAPASVQLYETLDSGLNNEVERAPQSKASERKPSKTNNPWSTDSNSGSLTKRNQRNDLEGRSPSSQQLKTPLTVKTVDISSDSVNTFPLKSSPKVSPDSHHVSNKLKSQLSEPVQSSKHRSEVLIDDKKQISVGIVSSSKTSVTSSKNLNVGDKSTLPIIQPPSFTTAPTWGSAPPSVSVTPNRPLSFRFSEMEMFDMKNSNDSGINSKRKLSSDRKSVNSDSIGAISSVDNKSLQDDLPTKLIPSTPVAQIKNRPSLLQPLPSAPGSPGSYLASSRPLVSGVVIKLDPIMSEASCDDLETSGFRTSDDEYRCLIEKNPNPANGSGGRRGWKMAPKNKWIQPASTSRQSDFETSFEEVVSEVDYLSEAEFSTVDRTTVGNRVNVDSGSRKRGSQGFQNEELNMVPSISVEFDKALRDQVAQIETLGLNIDVPVLSSTPRSTDSGSNKYVRDLRDVNYSEFSKQLSLTEAFTVEDKVRGYQSTDAASSPFELELNGGKSKEEDLAGRLSSPVDRSSSWGRGSVSSAISSVSSRPPTSAANFDDDEVSNCPDYEDINAVGASNQSQFDGMSYDIMGKN